MAIPPLVYYPTETEYCRHYERIYCHAPIVTFDGIAVRFRKSQFGHCFFESTHRNKIKDLFSRNRAERMDWIKATLQDANADLFVGWDGHRKRYDKTRRVAVVLQNYVVIIRLTNNCKANFVTAYLADSSYTIQKIRRSPRWQSSSA